MISHTEVSEKVVRQRALRDAAIRAEATVRPDYSDRERNIVGAAVSAMLGL